MKLSLSFNQLRWIVLLLVALLFAALFILNSRPSPASQPPELPLFPYSQNIAPPSVSAKNAFILDLGSKLVLLSKDADAQIYPASTTKMMTALVVHDNFDLSQVVTVRHEFKEGSKVGFKVGEQVTVEKLLYALLVQSGNDAAEILAESFPGGRPAFVEAMNQKAQQLHLYHTHFKNPTGLDEAGHYSSAADLVRLGSTLETYPELARIVSTENAVITSSSSSSAHVLSNVNALLGKVPGVIGIKTGFTDLAGQSLVTLVSRDNHLVMIAVLGSADRFLDTESLINWVYSNYTWK